MRVSLDTDLWTSGRLNKLARCFGSTEREALGALVMVYSVTQDARQVTLPIGILLNTVSVIFETDDATERFVSAMILAKLADKDKDGMVTIRGNQAHVDKISYYREKGQLGGKAKKTNDFVSPSKARAKPTLGLGEALAKPTLGLGEALAKPTLGLGEPRALPRRSQVQVLDLDQDPLHSSPSPLSSPTAKREDPRSPSHPADERVQGEKPGTLSLGENSRDTPPSQQIPPSANGLHQAISVTDATAVVDERRRYLADHRKIKIPLIASPADLAHARVIIARCGRDVRRARLLVRRYIAEDRGYWRDRAWPLSLLASESNHADFDLAIAMLDRELSEMAPEQVSAG